MAKTTGYDTPIMLTKTQKQLLAEFGLPMDFEHLTDDQYFAIDKRMSNEMMTKGTNDSGDGLNDYGELCKSVIIALPDDLVKQRTLQNAKRSSEAKPRLSPQQFPRSKSSQHPKSIHPQRPHTGKSIGSKVAEDG